MLLVIAYKHSFFQKEDGAYTVGLLNWTFILVFGQHSMHKCLFCIGVGTIDI